VHLYSLLYCCRYPRGFIDLQKEFRRDYTQLSQAFNEALDFLWVTQRHRIENNLDYHVLFFGRTARKIELKGEIYLFMPTSAKAI